MVRPCYVQNTVIFFLVVPPTSDLTIINLSSSFVKFCYFFSSCQPELGHFDCFCFPITRKQAPGVNGDCVKFVRSFAACQNTRTRQRREHVNNITDYVDGSIIYGSTLENFRKIRKDNSKFF